MRELQRISENVHLAVKKDFDSPHHPLHPTPSSPQCPPARELRDACLGLDLLCFKFPGNLALALSRGRVFPASQAPGLCHGGQTDGTPLTLWPVPAESNVQPPRAKLPARSLTGGQPAALHPLTANLSLHGSGTPMHRAGGGQRDMCFTHPRGMQALAWCSGQETGRLVQLPVPLKRRHQLQQVCGDTLGGLPAARVSEQDSALVLARCQMGAQWPVLPLPWPKDQEMSSPGLFPWLVLAPVSSLTAGGCCSPAPLLPSPNPPPLQPLTSPGPQAGAPTAAFPPPHTAPAGLLPARDGLMLSVGWG